MCFVYVCNNLNLLDTSSFCRFIISIDFFRDANTPAKQLAHGGRRRLSMAEELVHAPNLLILDEPISHCNVKDTYIITNAFRELVNKQKTVIATMFEVHIC